MTTKLSVGQTIEQYEAVQASYPSHPQRPTAPGKDAKAKYFLEHAKALQIYEDVELPEYEQKLAQYHAAIEQAATDFKYAILAEVDLVGHAKAEQLYQIAWDHGHSAGMEDVAYWVRELSELLK